MGKTYYKHRPDEEREHVKNASKTHSHAKYRKLREAKESKRLRITQDWVDWATSQDNDPNTIP